MVLINGYFVVSMHLHDIFDEQNFTYLSGSVPAGCQPSYRRIPAVLSWRLGIKECQNE